MWRIARDSGELDLNSPYSYVMWCRDFSATSVVARDPSVRADGTPVGFVTGFRRPEAPDTYFVWQVAVDEAARGRGLGRRMLDDLGDRMVAAGCRFLEATVTPDNVASERLFRSFALSRGAALERGELFGADHFPGDHEPEMLFRIGPLPAT